MREKMKEMDIRITELCELLHFSRPTMYRFIDNYELGKTRGIDRGVLSLFRYIDETPNIGKKNVISFILNNIMGQDDDLNVSKFVKAAKKYETSDFATDEKTDVIMKIMTTHLLDDIARCIAEYYLVTSNGEMSEGDIEKIGKFILFKYDIDNQTKLTKTQINKIQKILEGNND